MAGVGVAKEIAEEIKTLAPSQLRELKIYVYFLKARQAIDAAQLYFWTRHWQAWEREAEADKRAGRLIGDGSLKGLLKALKH